jgi:putative transposase
MARLARLVIPGLAHLVTQRGNGRARTFFGDDDYELYRDLLAEHCGAAGVEVWAWCLMPNHVHLILVPSDADGLLHARLRAAESIDRPLGDDRFLARIERLTGLSLKPCKRGPKPLVSK